jgi:hypothetical protein
VRIMLQRWITRVCEDLIILADEDLRAFIESDFGYQPTPRPRKRTSSGFGIMRRSVPDEDEDLQRARFELTKLEGQFFDTAKAIDRLAVARKGHSVPRLPYTLEFIFAPQHSPCPMPRWVASWSASRLQRRTLLSLLRCASSVGLGTVWQTLIRRRRQLNASSLATRWGTKESTLDLQKKRCCSGRVSSKSIKLQSRLPSPSVGI